jgi:hypothetical protein
MRLVVTLHVLPANQPTIRVVGFTINWKPIAYFETFSRNSLADTDESHKNAVSKAG